MPIDQPLFKADQLTVWESHSPERVSFMASGIAWLTAEEARTLALALLGYATAHGCPVIWARLPASMHDDAEKAGLVQLFDAEEKKK